MDAKASGPDDEQSEPASDAVDVGLPRFVGIGHSEGADDVSERFDEVLAEILEERFAREQSEFDE